MTEHAAIVNNSRCSACALGSLCLADGPFPDFELVGLYALFGVKN